MVRDIQANQPTHLHGRLSQALASCSFLRLAAGGGGKEKCKESKEKQEKGGNKEGKWVQHLNQESSLPESGLKKSGSTVSM